MKYKDWLKQQQQQAIPDPTKGNPIYCPDCGLLVCYDKDYMFMVLTTPIVCPYCDEVVIMPNIITYKTGIGTIASTIQIKDENGN